jgi:ribosome biogenesis GTPase
VPENSRTRPEEPLARLGWDEDWDRRWNTFRAAFAGDAHETGHETGHHVLPARVVRVHRGACDVETPLGPQRVETPAGHLVPEPTTGDWIGLLLDAPDGPRIVGVVPRRTILSRASVTGRSVDHQLAANVDTVVVAVGADSRISLGRVERFLALAWNSGARPVVVLTKSDLLGEAELGETLERVRGDSVGVEVLAVSSADPVSVEALREHLQGTVVLLGSSGAGKSTLANALLGEDRFAVGAVRSVDGKGRHTTVTRELVPLPGGLVLVDTPGLRTLGVAKLGVGLERTFADLDEIAVDCRFSDCSHTGEPGCAVLSAIDAGLLDQRRLDSYRRLGREQAWFASRTDHRLAAERRREWKKVVKANRDRHS